MVLTTGRLCGLLSFLGPVCSFLDLCALRARPACTVMRGSLRHAGCPAWRGAPADPHAHAHAAATRPWSTASCSAT